MRSDLTGHLTVMEIQKVRNKKAKDSFLQSVSTGAGDAANFKIFSEGARDVPIYR